MLFADLSFLIGIQRLDFYFFSFIDFVDFSDLAIRSPLGGEV